MITLPRKSFVFGRIASVAILLALTAASVLVHGYHLGQQDAAIYIPAIKKILDPSLYPYDSQFFLAQTRWMLFPQMVAWTVQLTSLPVDTAALLWHAASIFLLLLAAWKLARLCFADLKMQWSAVAMLAAARLLPILGTRLELTDRYLHPRDFATALILFSLSAALERRLIAAAWLAAAFVVHPTMALFGAFHVLFQSVRGEAKSSSAFTVLPVFASTLSPDSREVMDSRAYLFPLRWPWYAWVSVVAVFALLVWYTQIAKRWGMPLVEHVSRRAVYAGGAGIALAVVVSIVPAFEHIVSIEPMRVLHLVVLLCAFLGGGLLGAHPRRAAVILLALGALFFLADRRSSPSSPHMEWPGQNPTNPWIEAFEWSRRNTPPHALFALDPNYMLLPGEDFHGFRAFAERSMMADWVKDRSVAALEPSLAFEWRQQIRDREGWLHFTAGNFQRLKSRYGVTWIITDSAQALHLDCPFVNKAVAVCRIE